jgi:hypothetical protein
MCEDLLVYFEAGIPFPNCLMIDDGDRLYLCTKERRGPLEGVRQVNAAEALRWFAQVGYMPGACYDGLPEGLLRVAADRLDRCD